MSTTEGLNPRDKIFQYLLELASSLLQDDETVDQALHLSALILLKPGLSTFYRAGCHLILAYSEEQRLEHAQRAVELCQQLPDSPQFNELRQDAQAFLDQAHTVAAAKKAMEEAGAANGDVDAAVNDEPQPQPQLAEVEVDITACTREVQEEYEPALHEAENRLQDPGDLSEDDGEPKEEENRIPSVGMYLSGNVEDAEIDYSSDLKDHIFKDDDPKDQMSVAEKENDH